MVNYGTQRVKRNVRLIHTMSQTYYIQIIAYSVFVTLDLSARFDKISTRN